jgi:4-amino-4-deoxy-L-arabinose transferase-like glycosyltransferase
MNLVLLHRPPFWDEAAHALKGALIAHDLREGDLLGFLFDSYRQVYWPPLHSSLVAIAFLLTGPSLEAARAVSVVAFVLLAPTLFLVGRTVDPRHGVLAGSVAAALSLTSPGLIALAAKGMLELPGLLVLSLTMLIYCWLERHPRAPLGAHALLGVCTVVTYLIKSNYGVLLVIGIALTKLIAVGFRPHRLLTRPNLYAVLPLVIFCAIWFAYPPKVVATWNALVNRPYGGVAAWGLAGLLFYPRVLIDLSGSWWMSIILWSCVALAWRTRRRPGIVFLAVLALTLFIIGEFHHTKMDRHIMPMFPPMFVLTGVAGAELWAWLGARGSGGRTAVVLSLAGVAILHATTLGSRDWAPAEAREGLDVMAYVSESAREGTPTLILGTRGAWPEPPVVDWNLFSEGLLPVTAAGTAMDPRQERRLAIAIVDARLPKSLRTRAKRLLDRYDSPSMTRSLYPADRLPESQAEFEATLKATLANNPPRTIIAMVGTSDTTLHTVSFIAPGLISAGFRQSSLREFPRAGTRVYVYNRP